MQAGTLRIRSFVSLKRETGAGSDGSGLCHDADIIERLDHRLR